MISGALVVSTLSVPVFAEETSVATSDEFLAAISGSSTADTIVLSDDITLDAPQSSLDPGARVIEKECVIDLNDNTLDLSNIQYLETWDDVTITNGTIAVKNTNSGILSVYKDDITLNLEDVVITQHEGYIISQSTYLIQIHNKNCVLNITDCNIAAETSYGLVCANNTSGAVINITDSELKTASKAALFGGEYKIESSTIEAGTFPIRNADGATTLKDSTIKGVEISVRGEGQIILLGGNNVVDVENSVAIVPVAEVNGTYYKTFQDAVAAAKDDDTITIYTEEKIKMPGLGSKKDVTIQAADGVDAKIEITTPGLSGSDVTFNDVTLDYSNTGYKGLQHSGDLTYNNCTILGQAFLYGESDTFNNCTFEQSDVNSYNVWTYSSKSATFNNCTFNSIGRSVLVYREGGNDIVNVALNDCEFNATVPADGKAAIEIDPSLASFGVEINNCTANGFSAGSVSGNSLYNNKKAATKDKTSLIVVVDDEVVVKDVPSSSATAIIGTTIYDSLADAVDAAVEGDIIVLLGNVELDATVEIDKNITIDGANFKVTGASLVNPATALLEGVTPFKVVNGATVTFKNITVEGGSVTTGSDYQQQASFGYAGDAINVVDANVVVEDSTLIGGSSDAEWTASIGNGIDATGTGSVNVLNSTVSAGIPGKAGTFYMAAIEAEDTMALELKDVVLSSPKGNADRGTGGTDVINSGFDGNETPRTADVIVSGKITVDPNGGEMYNVPIKVKEGENVQLSGKFDEEYIADSIRVSFEEVEKADGVNGESDIYDIVLESTGNIILENGDTGVQKFINRLNSADITFMLEKDDDANIVYEILEKDGSKIEINSVNGSKDRYEFHYKNKDDADNGDTASKIVIGQVKITGYGEYTFKVNTNNVVTNMAHSTTTTDNIVDTYYPGGALEGDNVGDLVLNDEQNNGVISGEIKVPTKDLTINVTFNNKINDNEIAYQDMKVVISGGDLSADIVKNFGSDENALVNNVYTVEAELTEDVVYNVTVTGAGYRTARYEVKMDADKTLNFWNNVKDVATEIESGKDKMQTNFLAGDIVADNIINVYDLSAVVSYFGTTSNSANNFVMYDLNRDGMIDSRDVAYVLVSWNK